MPLLSLLLLASTMAIMVGAAVTADEDNISSTTTSGSSSKNNNNLRGLATQGVCVDPTGGTACECKDKNCVMPHHHIKLRNTFMGGHNFLLYNYCEHGAETHGTKVYFGGSCDGSRHSAEWKIYRKNDPFDDKNYCIRYGDTIALRRPNTDKYITGCRTSGNDEVHVTDSYHSNVEQWIIRSETPTSSEMAKRTYTGDAKQGKCVIMGDEIIFQNMWKDDYYMTGARGHQNQDVDTRHISNSNYEKYSVPKTHIWEIKKYA